MQIKNHNVTLSGDLTGAASGLSAAERFFRLDSYEVSARHPSRSRQDCRATVRVVVNGRVHQASAHGRGPVLALDQALKRALRSAYPCVSQLQLTDFRVRVLNAQRGVPALVQVAVNNSDGAESWSSVGVAESLLNASWRALAEAVCYKLLRAAGRGPANELVDSPAEDLSEAGYGWGV
jgi:2-isopropylmalate synthase